MSSADRIRAGHVQLFIRGGLEWLPSADEALAILLDAIQQQREGARAGWLDATLDEAAVALEAVIEAVELPTVEGDPEICRVCGDPYHGGPLTRYFSHQSKPSVACADEKACYEAYCRNKADRKGNRRR